ncbi:hypothetical protein INT46_008991 [Mucor plumbeus]|uniref:Uncharacterized protein n=1 Tax=Mucor plumbeus TaxID=97098 RepID=A0A8H7R2E4_9FUNG|nr:hypothetical protein INT46_008991 [Mucor plumbeus]
MYYKEIIYAKIQSVKYQRNSKTIPTCVDCGLVGHYNKNYYKCSKYNPDTADSVGTSCKRNQSFEMKQEKKEAKQQKTNNTNVVCSNCKELEVFNNNLGKAHQSFTRKIPFRSCIRNNESIIATTSSSVNPQSAVTIKSRIISAYDIIPDCIFKQNFWYSICQLVNNRKATNGTALSSDIIPAWDTFRIKYPAIIYETMSPDHVAKVAKEFCYQMVCQGNPVWPKSIQLSEGEQSRIKEVCMPLSTHIDVQVTLKSLSASPGKFVRFLAYILSEYEREHLAHNPYDVRRLPLPRLFTISPSPSFRWKFVTISTNSLCCFTKEKLPRGYNAQLDLFYKYFDFKGLGFKSIDGLRPNGLNNVLLSNTIKSDGFTVDFLFEKRRATAPKEVKKDIENHDLVLEDFEYEEVERIYQPVFIDPGRKAVYTAVIGLDTSNHQIRQCSTKEYYNITGSTKYSSRLQKLKDSKGLTSIETNIPTQKTCSSILYDRFIQYIIIHKDKLFAFYGKDTAKDRFFLYQGRQRAPEIMVNMLLNGDKKYNKKKRNKTKRKKWRKMKKAAKKSNERLDRKARAKKKINDNDASGTVGIHDVTKSNKWKPSKFEYDKSKVPLIVFGAGMVGKDSIKLIGLRHGVTGMFYRTLKKRKKEGELLVVPIDEFKTSRICNICKADTLYKASHIVVLVFLSVKHVKHCGSEM